jgi:hypothetical protein
MCHRNRGEIALAAVIRALVKRFVVVRNDAL